MSGDLISWDDAIAAVEKRERLMTGDKRVGVEHIKIFLMNRPAVDAEPVRHEHWIYVDEQEFADGDVEIEEKCSGCGRYVYRYATQPQDEFCPTCGAKMDKEKE